MVRPSPPQLCADLHGQGALSSASALMSSSAIWRLALDAGAVDVVADLAHPVEELVTARVVGRVWPRTGVDKAEVEAPEVEAPGEAEVAPSPSPRAASTTPRDSRSVASTRPVRSAGSVDGFSLMSLLIGLSASSTQCYLWVAETKGRGSVTGFSRAGPLFRGANAAEGETLVLWA